MLNLYKTYILIIALLVPTFLFAAEEQTEPAKQPVKIETKMKSVSEEKTVQVYTPMEPSDKFKIDPKEISNIKNMDIKVLQEKIESIKSKVIDSKSKLIEVTKDTIGKEEPISYLSIQHINDMSSRFNILRLTYMLDGKNVYSGYDLYKNSSNTYPVFNSFIAPGHHEVIVEAVYAGNAEGLFVPDGKKMIVSGTSYEKGRIFTPFKDRPDISFEQTTLNAIQEKVEK